MIEIEHLINERLITLDLKATSKETAIAELAEILFREKKLKSLFGFMDAVAERESTMSTYCGSDVAIPHAKSMFVKEAAFAFGRASGFSWGEEDENVNFVFMLAIPEIFPDDSLESVHIDLMASIAELALEEDIRNKWAAAKTTYDILETFKAVLVNKS
jgi:mannitol/fructose-specific phosphotransferase system IIA component (Ntr-type)